MTPEGSTPADRADGPDADLRDRLQRADPLAGRDPRLDPSSLEVLVSELTRSPLDPATQELGITPPPRRPRWLVPAVAGAAAAAVAAVALSGVLAGDPAPKAPVAQRPGLTLAVQGGDPATSMCMALSPELLAPAQYAFDGVVTSVVGDTATLTPSHWYAGERAGTVAVTVPPEVDTALVGAPRFELGKRYLVSGGDGQVGVCGASDAYSPELEAIYRSAFPG
ncbi:hypothetical protein [Oryzobacter telluris]|uniref:hypothetical protein n=1 Tax=Oryzobacter telluris TaxID=3149179 RepID=UPI00370D842D